MMLSGKRVFATVAVILMTVSIVSGEELRRLEELRDDALGGFAGTDADRLPVIERELQELERTLGNPESALAKACRGIVLSARAKEGSLLQRRRLFHQSTELLDEAVRQAPEDVAVRLMRAQHSALLPRAFGREDIARNDFETLLDIVRGPDSADEDALSPRLRAQTLFFAASWQLRNSEPEKAIELLEEAEQADVDDRLTGEIERLRLLVRPK